MLHIRFTGLLLFGLLLVIHSVHAQGGETVGEKLVSARKEYADGFGGRKMGGHEVMMMRKELGLDGDGDQGSKKSMNSGANYRSDGKCTDYEEMGAFNVKCKSWNESNSKTTSSPPKLETADHFVAFGADYHGPKRHPPKHN